MKSGKFMAAVMAGTIAFAAAAPVFASQTLDSVHDGWLWEYEEDGEKKALTEEEKEKTIAETGELDGDGIHSFALKCLPTALGDGQQYAISGDLWDGEGDQSWLSYGTNGDMWTGGSGSATISGTNTSVDFSLHAGDYVIVEIRRTGQDILVSLYRNTDLLLQMTAADMNFEGTVHSRVAAQYGQFTYYDAVAGDAPAALSAAQAQEQLETASGSAEPAPTTEQTTEQTTTPPPAQVEATTPSPVQDAAVNQAPIAQTGDEGVIFFVAVALLGCAVIAFASRKRFGN